MNRTRHRVYALSALLLQMLCLPILISGCFVTPLPQIDYTIDVTRLLATADHTLHLTINIENPDSSAGYQFLLVALPLTRVTTPSIEQAIREQLTLEGGMRGYRFINSESRGVAELKVSVTDRSVNGYDLLFVRRPSSSVTIMGTLTVSDTMTRTCEVVGEYSSFKPFAFERELNRSLQGALEDASRKLFDCLRL